MEPPPYRRIAAEIARRVAEGELRPGDRVPSVRRIATEWGVAMATATRVLQALRDDGVVRTVPRVGTVVAEPARRRSVTPRPAPPPRDTSDRDRVVRAAVDIADSEGWEAVSMRTLAAHLGMATMSLYRHVGNKDDLLLQMIDHCFADFAAPVPPPRDWRAGLVAAAHRLWGLFRDHPWLASVVTLSRVQSVPNLFGYTEQVMRALHETTLDSDTKLLVHLTVYGYVSGLAGSREAEARAEDVTGVDGDEWMAVQEPAMEALLTSGRFPCFTEVVGGLDGGYDHDLDRMFSLGLESMLDGMAARLPGLHR
ncbi:TetR family transcriptional regulator [Stackebrandtia albiflava]|uniref:TetR family transcriptional regulator n=1 Tax=Stackebrandtia albiflava TaxID=406432 RepID=A0A562V3Z8_9ACTN|nr:TetR/AcrR family transcriptional regulator C-terminal domain-containing protein [Stackebrandtia albiflava]TWJ12593.1 TetR family transcriptional regulator [Stackebrandtia albiflava]